MPNKNANITSGLRHVIKIISDSSKLLGISSIKDKRTYSIRKVPTTIITLYFRFRKTIKAFLIQGPKITKILMLIL